MQTSYQNFSPSFQNSYTIFPLALARFLKKSLSFLDSLKANLTEFSEFALDANSAISFSLSIAYADWDKAFFCSCIDLSGMPKVRIFHSHNDTGSFLGDDCKVTR